MKALLKYLQLFPILMVLSAGLFSCSAPKKNKNSFPLSATTDFYNAERYETKKKKTLRQLYTYNMKAVLFGNPCVTEVTRSYGFEYMPAFDSPDEPRNDLAIWFHNFTTSMAITFRHGLFWKRKVKKRIRYCAETTGDFNG